MPGALTVALVPVGRAIARARHDDNIGFAGNSGCLARASHNMFLEWIILV
jgi:hypothetical protein